MPRLKSVMAPRGDSHTLVTKTNPRAMLSTVSGHALPPAVISFTRAKPLWPRARVHAIQGMRPNLVTSRRNFATFQVAHMTAYPLSRCIDDISRLTDGNIGDPSDDESDVAARCVSICICQPNKYYPVHQDIGAAPDYITASS